MTVVDFLASVVGALVEFAVVGEAVEGNAVVGSAGVAVVTGVVAGVVALFADVIEVEPVGTAVAVVALEDAVVNTCVVALDAVVNI